MKLASVIIPTWNRKKLLAEAVESALAQTYRPLEIVVVDDGSTDGTREMMVELSRKSAEDVSIRFFPRPHLGVSAARQHGLEMARGEYVQFLDSDDLLLPEKLEKQIAEMERTQSACCLCRAWKRRFDSPLPRRFANFDLSASPIVGKEVHSAKDAMYVLASGEPYGVNTPALLCRKDVLKRIPPWPGEFCCGEDLVYFARLFRACDPSPIAFVSDPLALIRDHEESRATVAPRLSGWEEASETELETRRSLLLGRMEMMRELQQSRRWCSEYERGCARQLRMGYWDALHVFGEGELRDYEKMLLALSPYFSAVSTLATTRKVFGRRIPCAILNIYLFHVMRRGTDHSRTSQ